MKNLRLLKPAEIRSETHPAGATVENVESGLAARLIVDGLAEPIAATYPEITVPAARLAASPKPGASPKPSAQ